MRNILFYHVIVKGDFNHEIFTLTLFEFLNCQTFCGMLQYTINSMPESIYNPITAMGFLAMFTFQLDNTKR